MATGTSRPPDRNAMGGDPDPVNPDFPEFFFSLFFASTDLLGPQGHPPDVPVPPNPDPDWEIRFFRTSVFSFFQLFKLKDPAYGCLWTPLDPTRSPVPVPRYCVST